MRLHPVSWLLVGVLAFVLVDAALQTLELVVYWRGSLSRYGPSDERLLGYLAAAFGERIGKPVLDTLAWTIGSVVWLEILWRTLRGLRLRRRAIETTGHWR